MAQLKSSKPRDDKYEDWRVDDAMHTMLRAREIVGDKTMMAKVKKRAGQHASKMQDVANQASALAKKGLISDKQMAKLNAKGVKRLEKTAPLAKGNEGDGPSQTQRGVATK